MPKKKARHKAAPKAEPNKGGRPSFEPTEQNKGEVKALTVAGFTQTQVADYLGIDEKTLRAHFKAELEFSLMKVLAACVSNVVQLANGVPAKYDEKGNCLRAEIPMSLGPNAFILKTRGKNLGWSERVEVVGENGGAIKHKHEVVDDVRSLIQDELGDTKRSATRH